MKKPIVGQTVYSLNIGNAARREEQKLTPVVVKSVGRKYFVCSEDPTRDWGDTQYHLNSGVEKTDFCANSCIYETELEWEEESEAVDICKTLKNCFEYGRNNNNIPLPTLRKINTILSEDNIP
jgi:hypothetical protein